MKIYLAAMFKLQPLMLIWKKALTENGHEITSRWLNVEEVDEKSNAAVLSADVDLEDIDKADIVISYTLNRGDLFTGGGRHIEFGYALAKGKWLLNIGGHENVFHSKAITVPTLQQAIEILNGSAFSKRN